MHRPERSDVTIRDIAKAAGCSHSTVSRVLRGERYVKAQLREKVEKTALEMGYRVNPLVSTLMAVKNNRLARRELDVNLAWLNTHPNEKFWHVYPDNKKVLEAAKDMALKLGFGFDEIWAFEQDLTGKRLQEVLDARGIHGLLVSGATRILLDIGFDYSEYVVAAVGPEALGQQAWHRATVSHRQNVEIAFRKLLASGYTTIGYLAPVRQIEKGVINAFNKDMPIPMDVSLQDHLSAEISGYLMCQRTLHIKDRIPPFMYDRDDEDYFIETLAKWLRKVKPEAVICPDSKAIEAAELAKISVPSDMAIALTNISEAEADWSGILTHSESQAQAAVSLINNAIMSNKRGLPQSPQCMYIKGEWNEGWTAPPR